MRQREIRSIERNEIGAVRVEYHGKRRRKDKERGLGCFISLKVLGGLNLFFFFSFGFFYILFSFKVLSLSNLIQFLYNYKT